MKKITERYRIISGTPPTAELDEKGLWVKMQTLLNRSSMLKKDLDPLITTLEASGIVEKCTARMPSGKLVEFIRII